MRSAGASPARTPNVDTVESWAPGESLWRAERPLPEPRGGTGAATVDGVVVSVGSEALQGTSGAVYGFDVRTRAWSRLRDLPTPRHGLGVVAFGREVIAIGGGPVAGPAGTGAHRDRTS